MIDRFERFSFTISEINRYWHKLAGEEMTRYGLKGPPAVYCTTLYRYPEGIPSAKLAELCGRDKADVSRAVTQLEARGLVEKNTVNQRNYRAPIVLTQAGFQLAEAINEKANTAVENGGRGLTDGERAVFYKALELICSNLRQLSEEGL